MQNLEVGSEKNQWQVEDGVVDPDPELFSLTDPKQNGLTKVVMDSA